MEDHFLEIARIDGDSLEVNRDNLKSVFSSPDLASMAVALHIVIGPHNSKNTLILGQLADYCLNSWTTMNLKNPILNCEEPSQFFINSRKILSNGRQLVIFRHPLWTLRNDGSKTKVAHFFVDIWNASHDEKNYLILAGIAAKLSSSILFISEGCVTTKEVDWLRCMFSVSLKMANAPHKLQNIFFLLKSWTPDSGIPIGKPIAEDYLTKIKSSVTTGTKQISITKLIAENSEVFIIPKHINESSDDSKQYLRPVYRTMFEYELTKTDYQVVIEGQDILRQIKILPLLEELLDFHNNPLIEELIEEFKVVPDVDEFGDVLAEETVDDTTDYEEAEDISEKIVLPWVTTGELDSLAKLTMGPPKKHEMSFADFLKTQGVQDTSLVPRTNLEVVLKLPLQESEDNISGATDVHGIIKEIFKDLELPVQIETTQKQHVETNESGTDKDSMVHQTSLFLEKHDNCNVWLKNINIDENSRIFERCLLESTVHEFIKADVRSNVTAKWIFDKSVMHSMPKQSPGISNFVNSKLIIENIQKQLVVAMTAIISYQEKMLNSIKSTVFFETEEEFLLASRECRQGKIESKDLSKDFQDALEKKLDMLENKYSQLNSTVRTEQKVILSMLPKVLETKFKDIIGSKHQGDTKIIDSFLERASSIVTKKYNIRTPPGYEDVIKKLQQKLIQTHKSCVKGNQSDCAVTDLKPTQKDNGFSQGGIEKMDCGANKNQPPQTTKKISGPLQPLFGRKKENSTDPKSFGAEFNANRIDLNWRLSQESKKSNACILFEWDKVTVFVLNDGKPMNIYGPQSNRISFKESEITIGDDSNGDPNCIDIKNIADYFLSSNPKESTSIPGNVVKIFTLVLLKINGLVCNFLGHQPSVSLVVPSFGCAHLAGILISAVKMSCIEMSLFDKDICSLVGEIENEEISTNIVVLNDHWEYKYASASLFRVNKSYATINAVDHAWDTDVLLVGTMFHAHANALQKIPKSHVHKVFYNCIPSRKKINILSIRKFFPNVKECFVESHSLIESACKLVNLSITDNLKNENNVSLLIKHCSLGKKYEHMRSKCNHKDVSSKLSNFETTKAEVHLISKTDARNITKIRNSSRDILFDKLKTYSDDRDRNIITQAMREIDEAGSILAITRLVEKILGNE